uniref:Apple domain-containing protein n=1 Tax=Romanomermis culicivorax TaxID=13658 RepID=A0A915K1I0_ROMCU
MTGKVGPNFSAKFADGPRAGFRQKGILRLAGLGRTFWTHVPKFSITENDLCNIVQNQCDKQCLSSRYAIDHFLYYHDYVSYSQPLKTASLPENPLISRQCRYDTAIGGFFTMGLFARGTTKDSGHCLKSCLAIEQCESFNFVQESRDCYLSRKSYRNER